MCASAAVSSWAKSPAGVFLTSIRPAPTIQPVRASIPLGISSPLRELRMRFSPRRAGSARRWLLALAVVVGLAALVIWYVWPDSAALDEWSRQYDVTAARPDLIPPGTIIGDTPPPGWSR